MSEKRFLPNLLQEVASGCLLPFFLVAWILLSIVATIGCILVVAGYLDTPGSPPPPTRIYLLSAGIYLLYFLSVIGIIRENESGVLGFIFTTVILFMISVFSGGQPNEEINTFVLAIMLLLLLRLDEWKELSPEQMIAYYLEVREGENTDSKTALKLYRRLERLNRDVNPAVVLVGALSMPFAYLMGQWLNTNLSLNSSLVESVTLALVGIGPIIWLFDWWSVRAEKRAVRHESKTEIITSKHSMLDKFLASVFKRFLFPMLALFADWLEVVICAVIAGLSAILITGILLLPYRFISTFQSAPLVDIHSVFEVVVPTLGFYLFILLILVSAAEPRLKPVSRVLPEVPAALKTNFENLVSFLTAIVVLLVFVNPYVQSPFFMRLDIHGELIQQSMAGALLGYTFSARVRFRVFDVFVKLGQARSLRRIGRQTESFYTVYRLADIMNPRYTPSAYVCLVESALLQLDPLKLSCEHCVQELRSEARQNASNNLPYFELFNDVLERGL